MTPIFFRLSANDEKSPRYVNLNDVKAVEFHGPTDDCPGHAVVRTGETGIQPARGQGILVLDPERIEKLRWVVEHYAADR